MDEERRRLYQHLWHLVWALQQEEWLEEKARKKALEEIVVPFARKELKIDLPADDPEFLPKVAAALYQLLPKPPEQLPSIPLNLQELVKAHQDYLAKKAALKAKEPPVEFSVDDWIRQLQEAVNKKALTPAQKKTKETAEKQVNETREIFRQHVTSALGQEFPSELTLPEKIGPITQEVSQGIEKVLGDFTIPEEERETRLAEVVNSALKKLSVPEEQKVRAQNTVLKQTKEARETLREQKRVLQQTLRTLLVESRPTPEEEKLLTPPPAVIRQQTREAIKKELTANYPPLGQNTALLDDLTEEMIAQLPEEVLGNPARLLEQVRATLPKTLSQAGISPDEKAVENLSRDAILDQLVASGQLTPEQGQNYKKEGVIPIIGGAAEEATPIGTSWSDMDYYEVEPGELNKIFSVIRHPQTLPDYLKEKTTDILSFPIKRILFGRIEKLTGIDYNTLEVIWKFRLTARQLQQQIDWLEGTRRVLGLFPNLRPIRPGTKEYTQLEGLKTWQARLEKLEESLPKAGIAGRIFQWRTAFVRAQEKLQTGLYYYQLSISPLGPRIFTEMVAKRAFRRWIIQPLYERTLGRTFKWLRLKTFWEVGGPSILTGKRLIHRAVLKKLKRSPVGRWIQIKIFARIPGWETVKKYGKWILGGILSLFGAFAYYLIAHGIPAAGGFLGGLALGFWPSLKLAGAVAALPIPGARLLAIPVFFGSELLFGIFGARLMIWLKTHWPAFTTWLSGTTAQVGAGISGIIPSLTSALPEATLPILGATGVIVGAGTMYVVYIAGAGFHTSALPTQAGSLYIQVEKRATPSKIDNSELSQEPRIVYQISFWPTTNKLTNITVSNETKVRRADGSILTITEDENGKPLGPWTFEELSPGDKLQIQYIIKLDSRYPDLEDSRIVDTATVTADVPDEEKVGETQTAIAAVTIGQPPITEPEGWPTSGCITQGPNTSGSHQGVQAIDIGGSAGNTVYATHDGTAYGWEIGDPGYPFSHTRYGNFVMIISQDQSFWTYYAHLEDGGVFIDSSGQEIVAGTPIGIVGGTGNVTGPHLHYELKGNPGRGSQINNYLPFALPPIVIDYCTEGSIWVKSQYD